MLEVEGKAEIRDDLGFLIKHLGGQWCYLGKLKLRDRCICLVVVWESGSRKRITCSGLEILSFITNRQFNA